jgi:hypothetical protein
MSQYDRTLTEDKNITIEIKQIVMANQDSYGLKNQLNSRYLEGQAKCALYMRLVKCIFTMEVEAGP